MITAPRRSDDSVQRFQWKNVQKAIKPIREHLDLISSTVGMIANACFLAGALFSSIPEKITRTAFVAMNTIGFLYLDWQVSFTIKTSRDCQMAYQARNWPTWSMTALKAISAVSDFLLMSAGLIASLALWSNRSYMATAIYTVTRPWGVTFIFIAIVLDVSTYVANRYLRASLPLLLEDSAVSERASNVLGALKAYSRGETLEGIPMEDVLFASRIRTSMDKYTLETLEMKLNTNEAVDRAQLLAEVNKNIATQLTNERNTLGLRALGYVGLYLCKAHPNTIVQPITYFATSLLYTANRAYKKWREAQQRSNLLSV